jgi:hypothetical protein
MTKYLKAMPLVSLGVFILTTQLFAQDVSSDQASGHVEGARYMQLLGTMGMGYAHNKDMDDRIEGLGDNAADQYNTLGGTSAFKNDFLTSRLTYGVDLDFRYLGKSLGMGGSIGFHQCRAESTVSGKGWADKFTFRSTLSVVPVTGTLYYRGNIDADSFLLFGVGAGYYMATFKEEWEDEDTLPLDQSLSETIKTNTVGYHLKIEYNYVLDSGITFAGGILGRYVNYDKFKNDNVEILYKGKSLEAGLTGISIYLSAGISL